MTSIGRLKRWLSVNATFPTPLRPMDKELKSVHYAAWTGNHQELLELLKTGHNIGLQDRDGFTALHLAVFNMHTNVVKALVDEDPSIVDVSTNASSTALKSAIFDDNSECVKILVEAGARALDQYGITPIHLAVIAGSTETIKVLLDLKVDHSVRTPDRVTPMHFAALGGEPAVMTLLSSVGADVSCRDQMGRTPLHIASFGDQVATVKMLLEADVDVRVVDVDGKTALHYLAGNPKFAESLLISNTIEKWLV